MSSKKSYFSPEEVRHRRKVLGLSLEQASEGICSASYLSLIESGKRAPSFKTMRLLASKLGLLEISDAVGAMASPALLVAEAAWKAGFDSKYQEAKAVVANRLERQYLKLLETERAGNLVEVIAKTESFLNDPELGKFIKSRLLIMQTRHYRDSGNMLSASRIGELALSEISQHPENESQVAEAKAMLSGIYCETGDLGRAKELVDSIGGDKNDSGWGSIVALWSKSLVYVNLGQVSDAYAFASVAAGMVDEKLMPLVRARLTQNKIWIGLMLQSEIQPDAVDDVHWAQSKFQEASAALDFAYSLSTEALLMAKLGKPLEAKALSELSLNKAKELQGADLSRLYAEAANVALLADDKDSLHNHLLMAREALEKAGANRSAAVTWRQLGELYERLGDQTSAIECLRASSDLLGIGSQILERPLVVEA